MVDTGSSDAATMNGANDVNGQSNGQHHSGEIRNNQINNNKAVVVLGAQWGDEGKGKLVDLLAADMTIVCRCQVSCQLFN